MSSKNQKTKEQKEKYSNNTLIVISNKTELKYIHECVCCTTAQEQCDTVINLTNHLMSIHSLELKDYVANYNIKTFHDINNYVDDLQYADVVFCSIDKEEENDEQKEVVEKKPFMKINGEIVKRKKVFGIDSYERLPQSKKTLKQSKSKVVVGGLTEEDLNYIPEEDFNFDLNERFHRQLIQFATYPGFRTILLSGDTGLGKSESVMQVASQLKQPLIRIPLTGDTKVKDIFQDENFSKEKSKIIHVDKSIIRAMKKGYWLLVDEFSAGNPTVMFIFFQIMEKGSVNTFDGRLIKTHPMFKLFLTDNRIGNPNYYRYHGTMEQNKALLNRIKTTILFENLKISTERKILKSKYPDADDEFIDGLLDLAKMLRQENKKDNFQDTFPIRSLESICHNYEVTFDAIQSLELGYLNMITDDVDKNLVLEIFKRKFGTESKKVKDILSI